MPEFTLMLVDDHEIVRKGLREILSSESQCEIIGECADGRAAVAMAEALQPDVVVLDIAMPSLNGLETARRILKTRPATKILILTMHDSDSLLREAVEAGAHGLVLKSDAARDLITAVDAVRQDRTYFTPRVSQMIVAGFLAGHSTPASQVGRSDRLTAREREIVQLVAEGKSSKEVASVLAISTKTVETHRANLMRKLACHSVSELVHYAIRNKLIDP